jgi:hypothetical protein
MSQAEGDWADVLHKSQETAINLKKLPQMPVSVFLNHSGRNCSINLKKLPQMPASVFLNHSGKNWQNLDCSFYLPVSMSRITPVDVVLATFCAAERTASLRSMPNTPYLPFFQAVSRIL